MDAREYTQWVAFGRYRSGRQAQQEAKARMLAETKKAKNGRKR